MCSRLFEELPKLAREYMGNFSTNIFPCCIGGEFGVLLSISRFGRSRSLFDLSPAHALLRLQLTAFTALYLSAPLAFRSRSLAPANLNPSTAANVPGYCPLQLCIPACVAPALTIIWTALDLSPRTSPAPQAWPSSWALLSHWSSLVAQANQQVKMLQYGLQFWVWYPLGKDPTCACLQVHSCWHCAFKS